jgi:hypothetical protein
VSAWHLFLLCSPVLCERTALLCSPVLCEFTAHRAQALLCSPVLCEFTATPSSLRHRKKKESMIRQAAHRQVEVGKEEFSRYWNVRNIAHSSCSLLRFDSRLLLPCLIALRYQFLLRQGAHGLRARPRNTCQHVSACPGPLSHNTSALITL